MAADEKLRKIRDRLDEVIDYISGLDTKETFKLNEPLSDGSHVRNMAHLVGGVFKQWFDDLTKYRPELVYRPVKELKTYGKKMSDCTRPISEIAPFSSLESVLTDASRSEFFKDYRNQAPFHIPASSALIGIHDSEGIKVVANVYCQMDISEEFILNADPEILKKVLLAATYVHFLCDQLDYDRGLSG